MACSVGTSIRGLTRGRPSPRNGDLTSPARNGSGTAGCSREVAPGSGRGHFTGPGIGASGGREPPGASERSPPRDGDLGHRRLLLLGRHRGPDLQDAVLVARRDVVFLDALGQRHVADEGPVPELRPVGVLVLLLRPLLSLGTDV